MLRGASFLIAVTMATLAAFPIAMLVFTVLEALQGRNAFEGFGLADPRSLFLFALQGGTLTMLIAILPVLFGTAAMALLGGRFGWARSWTAWGVAGAVPAAILALLLDPATEVPEAGAILALTGIGCALVSRAFIRWSAPAPQA